jgi:hypothetical protein
MISAEDPSEATALSHALSCPWFAKLLSPAKSPERFDIDVGDQSPNI